MKSLTRACLLGIAMIASAASISAAVDAWLPENTLGLLRVPNASATRAQWADNPWRQFWSNPAMEPFRERFMAPLRGERLAARGDRSGIRWVEAIELAQGELLLALVPTERGPLTLDGLGFLLLADVGDQAERVRQRLASPPATETGSQAEAGSAELASAEAELSPGPGEVPAFSLNGVGFYPADVHGLPALFSGHETSRSAAIPGWAGVAQSWLILGSNTNQLASVLGRMQSGAGGGTGEAAQLPPAPVEPNPEASVSGWFDLRPLLEMLAGMADAADRKRDPADDVPMPKWREMLEATGLTGLESVRWLIHESPAGTQIEVSLAAPAATRRGLLEILALEPLDASPPPDVAADVVRFERIRLDFNRSWRAFERVATGLFPQLAGVLDLLFQAAGPGGERGDLRDALLPALGNDIVRYELAPRGADLTALLDPPSIIRLQSTNPPQLALSLKALAVLLPPPFDRSSQETLSGREVYSIPLPRFSIFGSDSTPGNPLKFAALDHAVVFTSDEPLLVSLLDPIAPARPALRDRPDLAVAAVRVGGMSQGLFGYHDFARSLRSTFAVLRQDPNAVQRWLGLSAIAPPPQSSLGRLIQTLDPGLLPPFEEVSRHFHFMVHAAGTDADRFYYRLFMPRPPQ